MRLKKAGIITKFVVVTIIIYATVSVLRSMSTVNTASGELEALKRKIAAKELSNAELRYDIEHSQDDEVIADIARESLGLRYPGEMIFYDNGG
jgi:cell division protein FtsB